MSPDIIIIALGVLLSYSLALSCALWATRHVNTEHWRDRAHKAEDAQHAAELHTTQQIDMMLDRVGTSPRLEINGPTAALPDSGVRNYISDETYDDETWNELRGEKPGDEDVPE